MKTVKKRLLLLGAGASADAGIPMASALTDSLLHSISLDEKNKTPNELLRFIISKLQLEHSKFYTSHNNTVDIEEIINTIDTLRNRFFNGIDQFVTLWNPKLKELEDRYALIRTPLKRLSKKMLDILENKEKSDVEEVREVIKSMVRINDKNRWRGIAIYNHAKSIVVKHTIDKITLNDIGKMEYFARFLKNVYADIDHIVTLSYDLLVENVLDNMELKYCYHSSVRDKEAVLITKLHGSINWSFGFEDPDNEYYPLDFRVLDKRLKFSDDFTKIILGGNGNKLTAKAPYIDMFNDFQNALLESDRLIVAGYSFRDDHINEMINRYLKRSYKDGGKIVVIDPYMDMSKLRIKLKHDKIYEDCIRIISSKLSKIHEPID